MALPIEPQPTPMVPTVVPSLHQMISPSLPSFLPTHNFHVYDPETISFGRGHHRSQEVNTLVRVEARDCNHYWITCHMDYTGVKFSTRVDWGLVIDPNPQDMLSQLDWVGSLMWLWWDIFLNLFDGPKACNIGDWEGRCKGEVSAEKG